MACSPTASWCEYRDLAGAVLTEPLAPDKGKVVPQAPCLGIEWDEKAVRKYAFRPPTPSHWCLELLRAEESVADHVGGLDD